MAVVLSWRLTVTLHGAAITWICLSLVVKVIRLVGIPDYEVVGGVSVIDVLGMDCFRWQ